MMRDPQTTQFYCVADDLWFDTPARMAENRGALDVVLTADDLATLDAAFPPPDRKRRLELL